jgi:hypothetical protein
MIMKDLLIKNSTKSDEDLSVDINKKLKKHNFCVLKNFLPLTQMSKILKILEERNKKYKEIRLSGKFYYKMKDYKRLDIGDTYKNPRFARFILFPEWLRKNNKFFELVKPVINLRNKVSKIKKNNYIYKNLEKGKKNYYFCDLVRMIQYPQGGGHLACHNDYDPFYPKQMINVLLAVTSKRKSSKKLNYYSDGGLYYMTNKNKKIIIDDFVDSGDLIFHNQYIDHGVNSIDPFQPLEINKLSGRITINFSIGKFYI